MAITHGRPVYLYQLDGWGYMFVPSHANRVLDLIDVVRQDYYTLRVQVVNTADISLDSSLKPAAAASVDLSGFTTALFGLKTQANFDAGGDYTAAWTGFNTSDTGWHALASGRFSIDIAPTTAITVGQYRAAIELTDGVYGYRMPDLPLFVNLRRELVVGTETTTPEGLVANSGTATITAGSDNVAVAFTGMTATGRAIPFFVGAPTSSIGATCGSGSFTITIGGPAASNTTVGYYVLAKS